MAVDIDYAHRGDISIAYQAIGDGPVDLIFGAGLVSHLDLMWGDPHATAFLRNLGRMGRLSDPDPDLALELLREDRPASFAHPDRLAITEKDPGFWPGPVLLVAS